MIHQNATNKNMEQQQPSHDNNGDAVHVTVRSVYKNYEKNDQDVSFELSVCSALACENYNNKHTSKLVDKSTHIPKFTVEEIQLGKELGTGKFGIVFEIQAFHINLETQHEYTVTNQQERQRRHLAENCIQNTGSGGDNGNALYCIKKLKYEIKSNPYDLFLGMSDILMETHFLASLQHPNIIQLYATSVASDKNNDYFIVLDRLYCTLEEKLDVWREKEKKKKKNQLVLSKTIASTYKGVFGSSSHEKSRNNKLNFYKDRLMIAYDLSSAISYLHSNKIIHRDIKPENIGFDIRGAAKIFDFGLAKEIPTDTTTNDSLFKNDNDSKKNETFQLTAMIGTPRYMAPEIAKGNPYNELCDVYSFAILLWEMLSLKKPYDKFDLYAFYGNVWSSSSISSGGSKTSKESNKHQRPTIDKTWSSSIKKLLCNGWTPNLRSRLTMSEIQIILKDECNTNSCRSSIHNNHGCHQQEAKGESIYNNNDGMCHTNTKKQLDYKNTIFSPFLEQDTSVILQEPTRLTTTSRTA